MSKSTDQIYVYSSAKYHAIFFLQESGKPVENDVVISEHQKHVIPTKKKKQELHQMLKKKEVFT